MRFLKVFYFSSSVKIFKGIIDIIYVLKLSWNKM